MVKTSLGAHSPICHKPKFLQAKNFNSVPPFFQTTYLRQLTTTGTAPRPPTTSTPCCRKPEPASRKNSFRQRAATFNRCKKKWRGFVQKIFAVVSRSLFFWVRTRGSCLARLTQVMKRNERSKFSGDNDTSDPGPPSVPSSWWPTTNTFRT